MSLRNAYRQEVNRKAFNALTPRIFRDIKEAYELVERWMDCNKHTAYTDNRKKKTKPVFTDTYKINGNTY